MVWMQAVALRLFRRALGQSRTPVLARRVNDSVDGCISLSLVLHVDVSSAGQLPFNGSATIDAQDHVRLWRRLLLCPLGRSGTHVRLRNAAIRCGICVRPLEMLARVLGHARRGVGRAVQVWVYYGHI